jgi:hypothetical protein
MKYIGELQNLNECRENRKLLTKLPEWLIRRWSRKVAEMRSNPQFQDFVKFIKKVDIVCNPIMFIP